MQKRAQSVIEISLLFCLAAIIVMPVILKINSSNLSFADKIDSRINNTMNSITNTETAGTINKGHEATAK